MKYIEIILKLQGDAMQVMCSIFKNPVTVNNDNKGAITPVVAP